MQVLPHIDGAPKHTGGFGSPQAFVTETSSRIRVIQNLINANKKNQRNGPKKTPKQPINLYTIMCEQLKQTVLYKSSLRQTKLQQKPLLHWENFVHLRRGFRLTRVQQREEGDQEKGKRNIAGDNALFTS